VYAVASPKIYFKQGAEKEGFKLSKNADSSTSSFIKIIPTMDLSDFVGDYDLQFDRSEKLYYIKKLAKQ